MTHSFAVRLGDRSFGAAAQLAAYMRKRVIGNHLDHPGQTYPADHFLEFKEPKQKAAIQEALRHLVDDVEPEVIRFVLHLAQEQSLFEALLGRFAGERAPPLPAEIRDAVADELASQVSVVPELRARALVAFKAEGLHAYALRIVLGAGSARERVAGIALAASVGPMGEALAHFAGFRVATQNGAEPLLAAAAALFTQPRPVRRAFRDGAIKADSTWADRLDLARTLNLNE